MAGERARNVRWGTRTKRQIKTILPYLGMILDQLANVQVRRFLGDSDSLKCVVGRMAPMRRTTPTVATVATVARVARSGRGGEGPAEAHFLSNTRERLGHHQQ